MSRVILSIGLGLLVTFVLFVGMAALISGGAKRYEDRAPTPVIDIVMDKPKSAVQERKRVPPPPPPPPAQPQKVTQIQPDQASPDAPSVNLDLPAVELSGNSAGMSEPAMVARDGDATPVVRIEPKYPVKAAREGKEGWVKLRFTIAKDGSTKDIEVIDAQPPRLFDTEAKRALSKWKYTPRMEGGKPLEQPGIVVQLDFKMGAE